MGVYLILKYINTKTDPAMDDYYQLDEVLDVAADKDTAMMLKELHELRDMNPDIKYEIKHMPLKSLLKV